MCTADKLNWTELQFSSSSQPTSWRWRAWPITRRVTGSTCSVQFVHWEHSRWKACGQNSRLEFSSVHLLWKSLQGLLTSHVLNWTELLFAKYEHWNYLCSQPCDLVHCVCSQSVQSRSTWRRWTMRMTYLTLRVRVDQFSSVRFVRCERGLTLKLNWTELIGTSRCCFFWFRRCKNCLLTYFLTYLPSSQRALIGPARKRIVVSFNLFSPVFAFCVSAVDGANYSFFFKPRQSRLTALYRGRKSNLYAWNTDWLTVDRSCGVRLHHYKAPSPVTYTHASLMIKHVHALHTPKSSDVLDKAAVAY